jgi:predicted 2-oxoglutarate/Fe(II)-dependent dioxygenase YbiX/peroxiredoxin
MRRSFGIGELAPWFTAPNAYNPSYAFDAIAGHWIILLLFGSTKAPGADTALTFMSDRRALLQSRNALFFGVSIDPRDAQSPHVAHIEPTWSIFWDFERTISTLYGVLEGDRYYPTAVLVDPSLRIAGLEPMTQIHRLFEQFIALSEADRAFLESQTAPVLVAPRIFDVELCQALITHSKKVGGFVSGVMREVDGRTVGVQDPAFKRRNDVVLEDDALLTQVRAGIVRRLLPMTERYFQWKCTRMERHLIACYRGDDQGFFSAHRDNTTSGTAHRKFAVSINLNAGDYEGGDLCFPEFGERTYRPPTGGAVVFSCSILHGVSPVTRGDRYAFLPFLYDEEGAAIRERNLSALGANLAAAARSDTPGQSPSS